MPAQVTGEAAVVREREDVETSIRWTQDFLGRL
jgi:hypothetical protein